MAYGSIMGQSPDTESIEQKVQNIENNYVPKSGTTMTGELNMGNHKVSGIANGTSSDDAVNKGQLDEVKNSGASVPFAGSGLTLLGHFIGHIDDDVTEDIALFSSQQTVFILGHFFVDYSDHTLIPICSCFARNQNIDLPLFDGREFFTGDASIGFDNNGYIYISNKGSHPSLVNYYDIYVYG